MKLAVITFTNGGRDEWLELNKKSIANSLPPNSEHLIIKCTKPEDLEPMRLDCLSLAEYITFVDDDDLVINDSLSICLDALEKTNYGVAFTDEQRIDSFGEIINPNIRIRKGLTYRDVSKHPSIIHHLAMIRTSAVPNEIKEYSYKIGLGAEWLIKASAALTNKAIHIQNFGYQWRQHNTNHHITDTWVNGYKDKIVELSEYLTKFTTPITKPIPILKSLCQQN